MISEEEELNNILQSELEAYVSDCGIGKITSGASNPGPGELQLVPISTRQRGLARR